MPKPTQHREELILQKRVKVSEINQLISLNEVSHKAYRWAKEKWGPYFQSPVDKHATTETGVFQFDGFGAFRNMDTETEGDFNKVLQALFPGRHGKDEEVRNWLRCGEPLSPEKAEVVKRILFSDRARLTNESLLDQPICRLVHRSQLCRDLDYQVVYQLTPAQVRLIDPGNENGNTAPSLIDLRINQRLYWGISETFQSLVAMFDSDLGSSKTVSRKSMTKELIRLTRERAGIETRAPDELNKSSPWRFWAPPPAFAQSVFHMLFWRSVITGWDLFRRRVVPEGEHGADTPVTRASHYYVLINWFNAAKFHLADYERLFDAIMEIARTVGNPRYKRITPLHKMKDIRLSDEPKGLLYPSYFTESKVKFPRFQKIVLTLPFRSLAKESKEYWELAWHPSKNEPTTIADLLRFLRDKALELVIWSKYQMEIRSVGMIPIQHLYHIELNDLGVRNLNPLAEKWRLIETKQLTGSDADAAKSEINDFMKEAIFKGSVDNWLSLNKVCGGTYRKIYDKKAWEEIVPLKSLRSESSQEQKGS
jgi:hypothetical protein